MTESGLSVTSLASLIEKASRGYGGMQAQRVRLHPETKYRLIASKHAVYLQPTPTEFIMGLPAEVDAQVPVGIVRLEFDLAPSEEE